MKTNDPNILSIINKSVKDVLNERDRQDQKWGEQNHDEAKWMLILQEEVGEFAKDVLDKGYAALNHDLVAVTAKATHARIELVQVAAVVLAMIECGDRNGWWPTA